MKVEAEVEVQVMKYRFFEVGSIIFECYVEVQVRLMCNLWASSVWLK